MTTKFGPLKDATFIDLFAGIGGFHYALNSVGAKCVFASEWDKHAATVYEANHKIKPNGDITKIDASLIPHHDVLCGGFPCQAFSISGKRLGFEDTRGTLFFEIARIVKHHNPKVLFLENVKNFASHDSGNTLKTVLKVLDDLNYDVHYKVINAAKLGFHTARERVYFVAFRKDLKVSKFAFPAEKEISGALADCLETRRVRKEHKLIDGVTFTENFASLVKTQRVKFPHEPIRVGTIGKGGQGNRVYSIDGPAITFSAYGGGNAAKTGAYLIAGRVRKLTPRECANAMGFPESFILPVNKNQAYKQFGNSVVVGVVKAIASQINIALASSSNLK